MDNITLREGISGYYRYHIAVKEVPLCGNKNTMKSGALVSTWGQVSHLHESYCPECEKLALEMGILKGELNDE